MIFHGHQPIIIITVIVRFSVLLFCTRAHTQEIRHNHRDVAGACLTAMLEHWLTQTDPLPSWYTLIDALRSSVLAPVLD